jgi:hypothetical protein
MPGNVFSLIKSTKFWKSPRGFGTAGVAVRVRRRILCQVLTGCFCGGGDAGAQDGRARVHRHAAGRTGSGDTERRDHNMRRGCYRATPGTNAISASGGSLTPGTSCTVTVNVTADGTALGKLTKPLVSIRRFVPDGQGPVQGNPARSETGRHHIRLEIRLIHPLQREAAGSSILEAFTK